MQWGRWGALEYVEKNDGPLPLSRTEILGIRCHFGDIGFPSDCAWWFGAKSERERSIALQSQEGLGRESKADAEHASLDMHVLNPGFMGTYQIAMCSGLMR